MHYVIVKYEQTPDAKSYDDIKPDKYLSGVSYNSYGFPIKSWTSKIERAIIWNDKETPKEIVQLLMVNTPYPLQVLEAKCPYQPFLPKYLREIEEGKIKLLFKSAKNFYEARIICTDRKGIINGAGKPVPIVVLVQHPTEGEILLETTSEGEAYSAQQGSHQALYIKIE